MDPNQKGLLFRKPNPKELAKSSSEIIVNHLKISLSKTLNCFPLLAGRLVARKNIDDDTLSFFVDCKNEGAEFAHAIALDLNVADILEQTYVPKIVNYLARRTLLSLKPKLILNMEII